MAITGSLGFFNLLYSSQFKELRDDHLSHFFDCLNCDSSLWIPNSNGLLRKENTKGLILKQKRTRVAENGED